MPQRKPLIWLNEHEEEGEATCGCLLVAEHEGHGPAFFPCRLHNALPELWRALAASGKGRNRTSTGGGR